MATAEATMNNAEILEMFEPSIGNRRPDQIKMVVDCHPAQIDKPFVVNHLGPDIQLIESV